MPTNGVDHINLPLHATDLTVQYILSTTACLRNSERDHGTDHLESKILVILDQKKCLKPLLSSASKKLCRQLYTTVELYVQLLPKQTYLPIPSYTKGLPFRMRLRTKRFLRPHGQPYYSMRCSDKKNS